jgi:hypothetical protein
MNIVWGYPDSLAVGCRPLRTCPNSEATPERPATPQRPVLAHFGLGLGQPGHGWVVSLNCADIAVGNIASRKKLVPVAGRQKSLSGSRMIFTPKHEGRFVES